MGWSGDDLRKYLMLNQPNYGHEDVHSLLEMVRDSYTMYNPVESESIKAHFRALGQIMDELSYEQVEMLFSVVSDLCEQYERTAFLAGLRVGAQMMVELQTEER